MSNYTKYIQPWISFACNKTPINCIRGMSCGVGVWRLLENSTDDYNNHI